MLAGLMKAAVLKPPPAIITAGAPLSFPGTITPAFYLENDPASIFNDAGSTPVTDGHAVGQWNDKSGNGVHLGPSVANVVYHAGAGHPYVEFDATGALASMGPRPVPDGTGQRWMAWAGSIETVSSSGDITYWGLSLESLLGVPQANCGNGDLDNGTAVAAGTYHTWILVWSNTTLDLFIDGVSDGAHTLAHGTDTADHSVKLGTNSGAGVHNKARCYSAGAGILSAPQIAALHAYMASR